MRHTRESILAANVTFLVAQVFWIGISCTTTLYLIQKCLGGLRVNYNDEMKGIDVSKHGGQSYTEFGRPCSRSRRQTAESTAWRCACAPGTRRSSPWRCRR